MLAILFDVDDTLYDQMLPFENAYAKIFGEQYGLSCQEVYTSLRKHSDEIFDASQKGEISMQDMYIYRMKKAMEDYQINITDEQALEFQEAYAHNQKDLYMSEQMQEILTMCHTQGVAMGVISNGPFEHQWKKIERLKLLNWIPEENIFISGKLGITKPDQKLFDYVQTAMKLSKDNTYFVGDSYRNDIVGAANAGWHSVWFNRRLQPSAEQLTTADYYVQGESALHETLQQIIKDGLLVK